MNVAFVLLADEKPPKPQEVAAAFATFPCGERRLVVPGGPADSKP